MVPVRSNDRTFVSFSATMAIWAPSGAKRGIAPGPRLTIPPEGARTRTSPSRFAYATNPEALTSIQVVIPMSAPTTTVPSFARQLSCSGPPSGRIVTYTRLPSNCGQPPHAQPPSVRRSTDIVCRSRVATFVGRGTSVERTMLTIRRSDPSNLRHLPKTPPVSGVFSLVAESFPRSIRHRSPAPSTTASHELSGAKAAAPGATSAAAQSSNVVVLPAARTTLSDPGPTHAVVYAAVSPSGETARSRRGATKGPGGCGAGNSLELTVKGLNDSTGTTEAATVPVGEEDGSPPNPRKGATEP